MKSKILRTTHYHPNTKGVYRGIWVFFLECGHIAQDHIYLPPDSELDCEYCDRMAAMREPREYEDDLGH